MKPQILKLEDFEWHPGNSVGEREALIRTIELAAEIKQDNPVFVELGTFKGINARNFICALNNLNVNGNFYSVDFNPFNKRLHFYPKVEWEKRCSILIGSCTQDFLEGKTVDRAKDFEDNSIVWLFVDACHCFECVRDEIEVYTPKVVPGGYMLFHDTATRQDGQWVTHEPPRQYGVLKAIQQSKTLKENFTFMHEVKTRHGIQVWKKNA
jgi:hypothetical protein